MRTPHRLLALTALAALAVGGAWLAPRWLGPSDSGSSVALAAETAEAPRVAEVPLVMLAPEAVAEPLETKREVVPEPSAKPTVLAELRVPDDAIWVKGRVIFPDGTPPDEHVRVVTRGKVFPGTKKVRTHEVELSADGSFRAAFAPKTRTGYVRLEAHYLYLEKSVKVDARDLPDEVLLEPALGARLLLTLTPPAGAELEDLGQVTVQAYVEDGNQMVMPRVVTEHENGVFELTSLRPSRSVQVGVNSTTCCDSYLQLGGLQAGETREASLSMTVGARISGRVLDVDGEPLKGVEIWATTESAMMQDNGWTGFVNAQSDEDGAFDLLGVTPGGVTLVANHSKFLDQSQDLGNLADGDHRQDLVLRMGQGGVVSGLVQWPDGRPVEGARVEVEQAQEESDLFVSFGSESSAKSDKDGRFQITGLGGGTCTVRARARPPREKVEGRTGLRSRLGSSRGPYWRVTLEDVLPSGSELVLVLSKGGTVSGRVVDDTGAAVEKFKVRVVEPGSGNFYGFGTNQGTTLSDSFQAENGRFALEGVPGGEWIATATARGYGDSGAMRVTMPQSGELTLVVPREATVVGVVLDPDGEPVNGARLLAELQQNNWRSSFDPEGDKAKKDGSFSLSLAPGEYEIHAAADGFAESVRETLEVAAGETREGLVLSLRRAARITGTLDASVGDLAGRDINLNHMDGPGWDSVSTDDQGRFWFEGLEPGRFDISLEESRKFVNEQGETEYFSETVTSFSLELSEGEERHVVLGAALANAVHVSGHVTTGGSPVSGLTVTWDTYDGFDDRSATTDASGRYELDVASTGRFMVRVGRGWDDSITNEALIPEDVSTLEFDVELPTAQVSGRLVGPDGEPVEEADVTLELQDEHSYLERSVESAEDGTFLFKYVTPGTYVLTASDSRMGFYGSKVRFGEQRIEDLKVPETGLEGIELRLSRSASVEGTVLRADGSIASYCYVFVRGKEGDEDSHWSTTVTDETGRFVCQGLGPGTYTIYAEEDPHSSAKHQVRLSEGATYALDLTLDR